MLFDSFIALERRKVAKQAKELLATSMVRKQPKPTSFAVLGEWLVFKNNSRLCEFTLPRLFPLRLSLRTLRE